LVLAILPMALFAQTGQDLPLFELGASLSYNYAYRSLKIVTASSTTEAIYNNLQENEKASFLPHFSIPFSWNPASHWRINSGVNYSIRGFETKYTELKTPNPGTLNKLRFFYRTSWLEIPITADYIFWKRPSRFNLFCRAGAQFGLNTAAKTTMERVYDSRTELEEVKSNDVPRKSSVFITMGIGSQYRFSKRFNLELLLNYQRGLLPANPEFGFNGEPVQINTYYWNFGAQIGIKYLFG